ncbi:MAG: methionine--tRNA ligase subunit beta, partial [Lachnospiraceae bacterium]|nr:methionine--tRNA ligase subunit beta [Lachnospiraceae bacterium]
FFGVDAVRYFVLHEMPFENDGVITWDLMIERFNSDLANTMGNLVNRTVSMSNKYFDGVIVNKNVPVADGAEDVDADLKAVMAATYGKVAAKMDSLRVADAISEIFALFKRCNKYIDETMPWALAKDESQKDRLSTVLYNLLNGILVGASLLEPFMPETAQKIAQQVNASLYGFDVLSSGDAEAIGALYPSGNKVTETPEILFARLKAEEVLEQVEAMFAERNGGASLEAAEEVVEEAAEDVIDIEAKGTITYDDFAKCQFQVGEIIACEVVPKSKKLLCSQVKIGSQVKQILSGIQQYYTPEEMVGKKVMVLVNLAPCKMAGMESEGMLLCAEDAEGNLALMTPEKAMPAGAEIC